MRITHVVFGAAAALAVGAGVYIEITSYRANEANGIAALEKQYSDQYIVGGCKTGISASTHFHEAGRLAFLRDDEDKIIIIHKGGDGNAQFTIKDSTGKRVDRVISAIACPS